MVGSSRNTPTREHTHIKLRLCVCHEGIQDRCSIAPLIPNPGTKWRGWMVNFTSRPFCLRKRGSSGRGTTGRTDGLHALEKWWISYSCGESNHDSRSLVTITLLFLYARHRTSSSIQMREVAGIRHHWRDWCGTRFATVWSCNQKALLLVRMRISKFSTRDVKDLTRLLWAERNCFCGEGRSLVSVNFPIKWVLPFV